MREKSERKRILLMVLQATHFLQMGTRDSNERDSKEFLWPQRESLCGDNYESSVIF